MKLVQHISFVHWAEWSHSFLPFQLFFQTKALFLVKHASLEALILPLESDHFSLCKLHSVDRCSFLFLFLCLKYLFFKSCKPQQRFSVTVFFFRSKLVGRVSHKNLLSEIARRITSLQMERTLVKTDEEHQKKSRQDRCELSLPQKLFWHGMVRFHSVCAEATMSEDNLHTICKMTITKCFTGESLGGGKWFFAWNASSGITVACLCWNDKDTGHQPVECGFQLCTYLRLNQSKFRNRPFSLPRTAWKSTKVTENLAQRCLFCLESLAPLFRSHAGQQTCVKSGVLSEK